MSQVFCVAYGLTVLAHQGPQILIAIGLLKPHHSPKFNGEGIIPFMFLLPTYPQSPFPMQHYPLLQQLHSPEINQQY